MPDEQTPSEPWAAPPPATGPQQPPPGPSQPQPSGASPPPQPWGAQPLPSPAVPQYGPQLAGFGARLGAYLLDALIVGVPLGLVEFIFLRSLPTHITACTVNDEARLCRVPTSGSWFIWFVVVAVLSVLALVFYFARPIGSTGQTVGKRIAHVRVLDAATGQPIGTGRAIGRQFAYFLSSFLCYLGFFWMLWDPQKQTWHDKIVSTVVVRA